MAEVGKRFNCGLHIAQYADTDTHIGYQGNPWNEGAYACAIRQYSSTTYIQGYNGRLDVNKFYGDSEAWDKYANPKGAKTEDSTQKPPSKSISELATEVIAGKWGNGAERVNRLKSAGYDPEAVQSRVNAMLSSSSSSSSSSAIKVGDSVKVINPIDYSGTRIALYYDRYTVMELKGDRAVIGVNGTVTCAIKVSNLRK